VLTLGQASKLSGRSKTTLARAIKAGRLSATRRDTGEFSIDASELSRVFPVTPETETLVRHTTPERDTELRLAAAEAELTALKRLLDEIERSRDDWKAQAERLALAGPGAPSRDPCPEPRERPSWWRRMFGRAA